MHDWEIKPDGKPVFRAQRVLIHWQLSHARELLHKRVRISEEVTCFHSQVCLMNEWLSAACVGKCFMKDCVITAKIDKCHCGLRSTRNIQYEWIKLNSRPNPRKEVQQQNHNTAVYITRFDFHQYKKWKRWLDSITQIGLWKWSQTKGWKDFFDYNQTWISESLAGHAVALTLTVL